jgi:hypothetical protein
MLSWQDIQSLSDAEVVERFDQVATNTAPGAGFWRDELMRRYTERSAGRSERLMKTTMWLTVANAAIATLAALAAIGTLAS